MLIIVPWQHCFFHIMDIHVTTVQDALKLAMFVPSPAARIIVTLDRLKKYHRFTLECFYIWFVCQFKEVMSGTDLVDIGCKWQISLIVHIHCAKIKRQVNYWS